MKIALLRIGIDTGTGGIHGPLFNDGTFEYIPIPDGFNIDNRTYGNSYGKSGKSLVEYFPIKRRNEIRDQSIHVDPEFDTFTYGDPTPPKAGLRNLLSGDLLVFYCGLTGYDFNSAPALYIIGYFIVEFAGYAKDFTASDLRNLFGQNFHTKHSSVFEHQKERLVLVKGSQKSRLLQRAVCISEYGVDSAGRPLKILSPTMRKIFGDFGGKVSIQRSPTRWVHPYFVDKAREFIFSLE
jgi:hypothetical protein